MESTQTEIKVRGMDCGDEVAAIKESLLKLNGVIAVEPNIIQAKVLITHVSSILVTDLETLIETTGVSVEKRSAEKPSGINFRDLRSLFIAGSGALLSIGLLGQKFGNWSTNVTSILFLLATLVGSTFLIPKAYRSLKALRLDMNVLMCIAVLGAIVIREFAEGAAVAFLFSLAEWLESLSLERARRAIQSLLKLVPDTAFLKKDGSSREVPIAEIKVGDILLVRSGSRIPLDGEVTAGSSFVNQAPLTGESVPVSKKVGDKVLAGSINGEGSLEISVTKTQENTKLAEIVRLVEEADKKRAPTQRFVDKFAQIYTPAVLVISVLLLLIPPLLLGGEWNTWLYRSLVLLVIACPCALVIATPVSIVSGLTSMARRGVLIKGGAGLESVGTLRALAVDKTGTITEGKPSLRKIIPLNSRTENEILEIAASIDVHSTHPLARAVVAHAQKLGVKAPKSEGYQSISGRGAEAAIDKHIYFVGNHRFAHENAVCTPELESLLKTLEAEALSVIVVGHRPHAGCKGEIFGVLGVGDSVRMEAKQSVLEIKKAGIEKVVMLSGDNQQTVDAIARMVGIDEGYGDLLPTDKVLRIKQLKERYGSIAMIGDGVNDAPAMASATIGIAMGGTGTDTAIEAADLTLMQDKLFGVADAITMGKRTLNIIRFNTVFALATKLIFLGLSIGGLTSLWLAIAADTGATLFVIANALRLLRFNKSSS